MMRAVAIAAVAAAVIAAAPLGDGGTGGASRAAGAPRPFWRLSERALDARLAAWQRDLPDIGDRVRAILLARLGTPVRLGCLGEDAPPDPEPVFRLDEADCTVLVLTTAALAHARSLGEAERNMALANYREVAGDRPIRYDTRLHFTEDRLDASPYFRDVTALVVPESLLASVTVTLNEKADGGSLIPIPWRRRVTLRYLPVAKATPSRLAALPPVVGVALVKTSHLAIGLAIAHEGVLLDGERFVHASSEAKEVVRVPFIEYLKGRGGYRFNGLVFYEFL
jgi:hypothetical protein